MKCPVCRDVTLLMSEKHGVEIDYCPQCRGIWLDRGELDKIIQRAKAMEQDYEREYDRDYRRDHREDGYSSKKKKKSGMFGELFEMFGGEGD